MKLTLGCPWGRYDAEMRIMCRKADGPCAHQYFMPCKGWAVLSPGADTCPIREAKDDGAQTGKSYTESVRGKG